MRWALGISYLGQAYDGWQSQPSGRTVQDQLEAALSRFAAQRQEFLAAGALLAVVQIPIGEDPAAVLLYRRGPGASAPATQRIAPPGSLSTRYQLRRYLLGALGSLASLGAAGQSAA